MVHIRTFIAALCVAAVPFGAQAQNKEDHQEHHPEGPTATAPATPAPRFQGADRMAAMEQHMKAMQAMREKMAAAKTPEARQALMAEHMKLMQDGMAMMAQMRGMSGMQGMQGGASMGGNMAERQQMMEKRMDMMESMMQMMMDRLPPAPAKQ